MNTVTAASPDLLYPYVVPASWVDHVGSESLRTWPISDEVHVVLVFDGQGTVRNARPHELEALQLDETAAFDHAAFNLATAWHRGAFQIGSATLMDDVAVGCARGNWMAPAAGLLLGNLHAALCEQFGCTEVIAVAVNQECLFAFPADERTLASTSLRQAIDDEFRQHPKPISRQWLLLDGQWPRAYPGAQRF